MPKHYLHRQIASLTCFGKISLQYYLDRSQTKHGIDPDSIPPTPVCVQEGDISQLHATLIYLTTYVYTHNSPY